ncbi:hypothetical protein MFRU_002g01490 [Monilinia fructicola]|nr:hypothetical protein MFRU_002g01490 [Monilinia fructicola]
MKFPSTFIFLPFLATITIQLDSKHGDVDVSTLSPAEYVAALKETINHQYSIIQLSKAVCTYMYATVFEMWIPAVKLAREKMSGMEISTEGYWIEDLPLLGLC